MHHCLRQLGGAESVLHSPQLKERVVCNMLECGHHRKPTAVPTLSRTFAEDLQDFSQLPCKLRVDELEFTSVSRLRPGHNHGSVYTFAKQLGESGSTTEDSSLDEVEVIVSELEQGSDSTVRENSVESDEEDWGISVRAVLESHREHNSKLRKQPFHPHSVLRKASFRLVLDLSLRQEVLRALDTSCDSYMFLLRSKGRCVGLYARDTSMLFRLAGSAVLPSAVSCSQVKCWLDAGLQSVSDWRLAVAFDYI